MTITDKEFIKWVCDMIPNSARTITPPDLLKLDYNILMKAVENINADKKYSIHIDDTEIAVFRKIKPKDFECFSYVDGLLLALQHALKYIMENER